MLSSKKADRNKTIDRPFDKCGKFFKRCIEISQPHESLDGILDRTVNGNVLEVCQFLPHQSVDLIIADPPYNLTKSFNGTVFSKKKDDEYEEYTRQWLSAVQPLLKEKGSIYVCCDWESSLIIGRVLGEFFKVRNRITWQREKGRGAKANWKNGLEDIWFATKSDKYTFNLEAVKVRKKVIAPYRVDGKPKDWVDTDKGNYRDTCTSNFWDDITIPFWSMAENTAHPTQKSEKLIAKLILASSCEGDIVFDPFLGSGTTSVVAKKLQRHYLGVEIEPQYCAWAEERLEMADDSSEIQGYCDGVFWARNSLADQEIKRNKVQRNNTDQIRKRSKCSATQTVNAQQSLFR